jgi:hypothetical protein
MPYLRQQRVVSVADLSRADDQFVNFARPVEYLSFSGLPSNRFERLVARPRLSRYRAALAAVRAAQGAPIISHLPRMTAAVSLAQTLTRRSGPHLAFSFNFTELPKGIERSYMQAAFANVAQFFVFSEFEKVQYPRYFSLPEERFRRLLWAQSQPLVSSEPSPFPRNGYVSAVGGEGRDYRSLLAAAELLPEIIFVIIARPGTIVGPLPNNVRVFVNLAPELTWRIAMDSSCMIVPLKTRTTCCGHITLVAGELLGIPMISTVSEATQEYTEDISLCEPGDVGELTKLIRIHHNEVEHFKRSSSNRILRKLAKYSRKKWDDDISNALKEYM